MDNNTIKVLKGPDRVRKRPAVIFGADGKEGAVQAVKMVLSIFINEAVKGYCNFIRLQILNEKTVKITSCDRGFLISDTEVDGHPEWYYNFCEMYPAPRNPFENGNIYEVGPDGDTLYAKQETLPKFRFSTSAGLDICCVQYASDFMTIRSIRDGKNKVLHFRQGVFIKKEQGPCEEPSRTEVTFKLDSEVFGNFVLSCDNFREYLRAAAVTVKGLKCQLCDKKTGQIEEFYYENGTVDYIRESVSEPVLIFQNEIEACGRERYNRKEYSARLKITVGLKKDTSETLCFHNFKLKTGIGPIAVIIKEEILVVVKRALRTELTPSELENNLILLIESNCEPFFTDYLDSKRQRVNNRLLKEMAEDVACQKFYEFLTENKEQLKEIFGK